MSQLLHGSTTIHSPRKHIVPTHLNLPDQVMTVWSLSLTARQLLLLLVGGGIGGTVWQHLFALGYHTLAGQVVRFLLVCLPFLFMLVLAYYQYAGRSLEVWLIVLVRYHLRPKRYLWRSIRARAQYLYPLLSDRDEQDEPDLKERASLDGTHDLARSVAL